MSNKNYQLKVESFLEFHKKENCNKINKFLFLFVANLSLFDSFQGFFGIFSIETC